VLLVKAPLKRQKEVNSPDTLFLYNIGQLLTLRGDHAQPRRGPELAQIGLVKDAAVLCNAGKIVCVGTTRDAVRDRWIRKNRKRLLEIDCRGAVLCPGFVDSHTHPAFVGPRLVDFEKRIAGATYEEIGDAGGGIRSSVEPVRRATVSVLTEGIYSALQQMQAQGTTTVEAKSGYGLSLDSELKSLEAIRHAARLWPGTVVSTLLAAHVVPPEFALRAQDYVKLICNQMIPQAARLRLAQFVDVFCDRGAFSEQDSIKIFESAKKHGLETRAHVSQLVHTPLDALLSLNPASLDHVDHVSDTDVSLLARCDTVATLVPGANYFLGLGKYPPARKLIDAGAAVALATDYNPGSSPTLSMPFVLSLACTHLKMSPAEAITAATVNGACALRMQQHKGSIEPGKDADLVLFDVKDYREIAYWIAADLCQIVIANGLLIPVTASTREWPSSSRRGYAEFA